MICTDRDVGYTYACDRCVDDTRRRLRELEQYALVLTLTAGPLRAGTSRRAPGYTSRSPARDDVVVMLDVRSAGGASVHRLHDPRDADEQPYRSILGSLAGIADWIREEQQVTRPSGPPQLVREVGYLLGQLAWCAQQQWIDELADDIRELHAQARQLAGDAPPRPLGTCIVVGCTGTVYPVQLRTVEGIHDGARCSICHRTYDGLDLVRLRVAQEAS
ncbi:hypothetical protein [Longimycelium tulufanense]|uniref:hypothetical protein n=1 Tax=Longimycelium tulufanense TaxID=907463 RepID=UPI00166EF941|nr:hypothetical protein [Longimycelium tulufanense]